MKNIEKAFCYFEKLFPNAETELYFSTPFEALVAVMLSAQCTDRRVNEVTKVLFKNFNTPQDFAELDQKELEKMIYSLGFYHNKAKNIIKMSQQLIENFEGKLPTSAKELETLAGVGKKTANVVASFLYNEKVMGVDTHIFRVLNRLGFVNEKTPNKTADSFMKKYPNYLDHSAHLRMVLFGRYFCTARNPKCENCELKEFCKYTKKGKKNVCR